MEGTFLSRLERAGGSGILPRTATLQERLALSLHLVALKKQGHAVAADETIENGEESGDIRVIHYRTCNACRNAVANGRMV